MVWLPRPMILNWIALPMQLKVWRQLLQLFYQGICARNLHQKFVTGQILQQCFTSFIFELQHSAVTGSQLLYSAVAGRQLIYS